MAIDENRNLQRQLYGEPLADIAGRVRAALGLTQGALADVLGLSAPMLSQLLSGQRAKIGNPAVLGRLQELIALASRAASLAPDELDAQVAAIRGANPTISTASPSGLNALRTSASAEELERLAGLTREPALAKLLREAARHG